MSKQRRTRRTGTARPTAVSTRCDRAIVRRAAMALPTLTATQVPLLIDALAEKSRAGMRFALLHEGVYLDHLAGTVGAETRAFAAMHRIPVPEAFARARATAVGDHPQLPEDTVKVLGWMRESYSALAFAAKDRHAYFAVEETTALILAGAQQTVTEHSVTASDLPSPNGVAYLHHTDGPLMLAWSTFDGVVSVSICTADAARTHLLDETEPVSPPLPVASFRLSADGTDTAPVPILDSIEACADLQWGEGQFDHYAAPRAIPVFLSFVHMLRQDRLIDREGVAARAPAAASGSGRGKSRSRGASVTLLRYGGRRSHGARSGAGRRYSHRWVVRGHWRRQWYPSVQRHAPIWITDYIAGPDDAPIVVGDKVRVVSGM